MTESKAGWKRQGFIPASRRPPEHSPPEPIFTFLAQVWRSEGRTVPGRPDPEWEALISRGIWPR